MGGKRADHSVNFEPRCADKTKVSVSYIHRVSYRDLALRSLDQLPPFSPVLNHLIASMADEDVSFARLAGLIERDTVLSGNVLRLVNSALYGRRGTVSSVRAAVSILGLTKLRNYLLGLSVAKLWAKAKTPREWSMARFNDHAMAVGVMADLIVQKSKVEYPEGAFVGGLLHDLGRMMIAIALPDEYSKLTVLQVETARPMEVCEQELLEVTHSELSAAALLRWNLPAPIQKAVLYHHAPQLDPGRNGAQFALSLALWVANEVVDCEGYSIGDHEEEPSNAELALRQVGLEGHGGALLEAMKAELESMKATA